MNPEQQRVAIAKACGWTAQKDIERFWRAVDASGNMTHELWVSESNVWAAGIPNFLNDLNAMHEAEKVLPHQLSHIDYWQKGYGRFQTLLAELTITPYSATASQRAEAFLRTIGKWEEAK